MISDEMITDSGIHRISPKCLVSVIVFFFPLDFFPHFISFFCLFFFNEEVQEAGKRRSQEHVCFPSSLEGIYSHM